jgi:hypothetical protein
VLLGRSVIFGKKKSLRDNKKKNCHPLQIAALDLRQTENIHKSQ